MNTMHYKATIYNTIQFKIPAQGRC